ncbi:MAG: hypothetical protein JO297_04220 [Nitrososphaeraceae archaeon]|nr:hypothetical protein [Nitrososphaeraceae archaeon]
MMTAQRAEHSARLPYIMNLPSDIVLIALIGFKIKSRLYHKLILLLLDHLSSPIIEAPTKWLTTGATLPI